MFLESLILKIGFSTVTTGYKYRKTLFQRLLYQVLFRNKKIRISLSCLLRIEEDGKYLLIKNKLRQQNFGPIGGALKYYSTAKQFLDSIEFEADDRHSKIENKKLKRDLRGFIEAKHLFKLIEWFEKGIDRENNCLHRELKEELVEIKSDNLLNKLNTPEFCLIRKIHEKPHKVPGKSFLQFRIFRIEEFSLDYINESKIIDEFRIEEIVNDDLIWVTSDEIRTGIDKFGNQLGSHCNYLLAGKKILPEDRPWTLKN